MLTYPSVHSQSKTPTVSMLVLISIIVSLSALIPPTHWPPNNRPMPTITPALPDALLFRISADQGRDMVAYHITQTNGILAATNPAQGLGVTFGPNRMTIQANSDTWGLILTGWGRGDSLLPPTSALAPTREANRLTYPSSTLTSWYVNGPGGVQQGWTLATRPAGNGQVTLALQEHGTLRGTVDADGHGIRLSSALRYGGLLVYDAAGRMLPAFIASHNEIFYITVDDHSATYPVTIDPWVQTAKLTASDRANSDWLGNSVAVSGDGSTIVAGAPNAASGGVWRGAAYIYTKPAGGWATATQTTKLIASDRANNDTLGYSVAISNDGSTIVAGAFNVAAGGSGRGAVYVYIRPVGGWSTTIETAKLTASDRANSDLLGWAVAVSGDGSTIVTGAIGHTAGRGAVYIFTKPTGGWSTTIETAKLTASDGVNGDTLGWAVAVSGDGSTIVAGAYTSAGVPEGSSRGAVYVYTKPTGGWATAIQTAKLTASDGANNDLLGHAVAISNDGSTIVAGASNAAAGGSARGAVYVYTKPVGNWATTTQIAKLTASDGVNGSTLGVAMAVSSDGGTVVAGASGHTAGRGAVYIYTKPFGSWTSITETAKLTASDGVNGEILGSAVAVNSDGSTVVAGAPYAAVGGTKRGAAYVYQDPAQQLDIAVGFTVDSYRERGQCYDVIVTLRNNTEALITRNISLSEQATYLNNEGQPAPLLTGRTDRYFDCDTGTALAVNGTINRSLTIPANGTAQLVLRLSHNWDWIERRTVTSSIYGVLSDRILDALVEMGLKGSDLAWVIESAQLYEDFGKLFYEKHGVRPRSIYRYTLQVEGLEARLHRDVEVVVNEFQQGWFRGSFAAGVHANISCLFWYNPLVAPGCALAISTAETLYLAAYGEVALTATSSLASSYTELVIPQPLTLSVLNQISDPGQRAYVEQHIQAEALQRAALESLRRSTAATMADDGAWALRQRQHAQHLLQQAAAQLGAASRQAATLVAGLTPPTAAEIAAYQAALERDGFDATTRTIFVDVGVAAADQEALRADLLTLAPEGWPELSVLPTALSAYERSVAELASTAAPTVFLPLVRR